MSPHKNLSLSEQAAEELLEMISVKKKYSVGDKIPNEAELASLLKVGRSTVREAVKILISQNILHIERGKGTYVVAVPDYTQTTEPSLIPISKSHFNLKDLFEIRLIFEPEAAYLAAKRASDSEIEKICKYEEIIREKIIKGEDRTKEEYIFHSLISKATHNNFMKELQPIISKSVAQSVPLAMEDRTDTIEKHALIEHKLVADFLRKRDAQGAKTAMKLHIVNAMNNMGIDHEDF